LEDLGLPAQTAKDHPDEGDEEKQADDSEEHCAQDLEPTPAQHIHCGALRPRRASERGASVVFSYGHG
jgi:hypothetical protein